MMVIGLVHRHILLTSRSVLAMGRIWPCMRMRFIVMHCDRWVNVEEFTKCPACLKGQAEEHENNE